MFHRYCCCFFELDDADVLRFLLETAGKENRSLQLKLVKIDMGVSKNRGTPKWMVKIM